MSQTALREITSSDKLIAAYQELDNRAVKALTTGYLYTRHFIAALHTAVDTIDATQGGDRSSVGIEWVKRNVERFRLIFDELNRLPFFAGHVANPHIIDVLCDEKLAGLFTQVELRQLATDIAQRHVMPSMGWIRCLYRMGLNTELLAGFVCQRINNQGFKAAQTDPFVEAYLIEGAGEITQDPLRTEDENGDPCWTRDNQSAWSAAGAHLHGILMSCAERRPDLFFKDIAGQPSMYDKLWAYAVWTNPDAVLEAAANSITTLAGTSITLLTDLSSKARDALVRKMLPGSLELLVDYLFSRDYLEAIGISINAVSFTDWERTVPTNRAEFCAVFRRLHWTVRQAASMGSGFQRHQNDGAIPPEFVMEALVAKLNSFGYVIGMANEEYVPDKGYCLVLSTPKGNGIIKYVHDGTGPSLNKGAVVIIDLCVPGKQLGVTYGKNRVTVVETSMVSAFWG